MVTDSQYLRRFGSVQYQDSGTRTQGIIWTNVMSRLQGHFFHREPASEPRLKKLDVFIVA